MRTLVLPWVSRAFSYFPQNAGAAAGRFGWYLYPFVLPCELFLPKPEGSWIRRTQHSIRIWQTAKTRQCWEQSSRNHWQALSSVLSRPRELIISSPVSVVLYTQDEQEHQARILPMFRRLWSHREDVFFWLQTPCGYVQVSQPDCFFLHKLHHISALKERQEVRFEILASPQSLAHGSLKPMEIFIVLLACKITYA